MSTFKLRITSSSTILLLFLMSLSWAAGEAAIPMRKVIPVKFNLNGTSRGPLLRTQIEAMAAMQGSNIVHDHRQVLGDIEAKLDNFDVMAGKYRPAPVNISTDAPLFGGMMM
jgi:hypothetical protein